MRTLGATTLLVVLAVSGCTAAATDTLPTEKPAVSATPRAADPGTPSAAPTAEATRSAGPVDPERRTAVAQSQVLDAALTLVEAGRLDDAQAMLRDDGGFGWTPSGDAEWADEYDELRASADWYLQLFDADGPDGAEIDAWVSGVTARLAAFREATGLRTIG